MSKTFVIGCDNYGYNTKMDVSRDIRFLNNPNFKIKDIGTHSLAVTSPEDVLQLVNKLTDLISKEEEPNTVFGIFISETGLEASIYANKNSKIKCVNARSEHDVAIAKKKFNINMVSIGISFVSKFSINKIIEEIIKINS